MNILGKLIFNWAARCAEKEVKQIKPCSKCGGFPLMIEFGAMGEFGGVLYCPDCENRNDFTINDNRLRRSNKNITKIWNKRQMEEGK